ncbi:MAG: FliH/SctL family protein [Fibrobacterota bacterium]
MSDKIKDNKGLVEHLAKAAAGKIASASSGVRNARGIIKKSGEYRSYPSGSGEQVEFGEFAVPGRQSASESETLKEIAALKKKCAALQEKITIIKRKLPGVKKEIYKRGFIKGKEEGKASAEKKMREETAKEIDRLSENIKSAFSRLEGERKNLIGSLEKETVEAVKKIVSRVIFAEAENSVGLIANSVKAALDYINSNGIINIKVNPDDYNTALSSKDIWLPVSGVSEHYRVVKDPSVERGGFLIESDSGNVDASLGTRISGMEKVIDEVWEAEYGKNSPPEGDV